MIWAHWLNDPTKNRLLYKPHTHTKIIWRSPNSGAGWIQQFTCLRLLPFLTIHPHLVLVYSWTTTIYGKKTFIYFQQNCNYNRHTTLTFQWPSCQIDNHPTATWGKIIPADPHSKAPGRRKIRWCPNSFKTVYIQYFIQITLWKWWDIHSDLVAFIVISWDINGMYPLEFPHSYEQMTIYSDFSH